MYNGIGLSTVRGTATSGFVQYNAGHVRNSSRRHRTWRNATDGGNNRGRSGDSNKRPLLTDEALKEGASSLALHEKKRQLEVRLLEFRDVLEERGGLNDDDIDREVDAERKRVVDMWEREEKRREEQSRRKEGMLLVAQQQQQRKEEGEEDGGVKLLTEGGENKEGDENITDA